MTVFNFLPATTAALPPAVASVACEGLAPAVVSFACGGLAGCVGACAVYPIDYAKTQLQTEEGKLQYENGIDVFVSTLRERGPLGLYRGLGTQCAGVAPEKAIKLFVNEQALRSFAAALGGPVPLVGEAAAGFMAGCAQVVITNPLEAVKIRLQTDADRDGSAIDTIRELGWRGLYRGSRPCLYRDATFSLLLFPIYHAAKQTIGVDGAASSADTAFALALAGLLAAAPAAAASTPFDVIKTRVQAAEQSRSESGGRVIRGGIRGSVRGSSRGGGGGVGGGGVGGSHTSRGSGRGGTASASGFAMQQEAPITADTDDVSVLAAARAIAAREGAAALFSGMTERVLRSAPQFAVTLSTADLLKQYAAARGWM